MLSGGPTRIRYYRGTFNVSMGDNVDEMSCELSDGSICLFNTAIVEMKDESETHPEDARHAETP